MGAASGRAGRSSPGPPSSRWSGASPRLAAAGHVGRWVCAQTLESARVPGDVAFERLGLGPVPQGEGGAASSSPPFSSGSGSRGETWGTLPNPLGSRGSGTRGREGNMPGWGGTGAALPPALAGVSSLPPGGL